MTLPFKNNLLVGALIALIAGLIFIPFIGNCPLFDWDEVNFAECAREMVISKKYAEVQLNYQPFWEKPPLFIWMQAACMNVFGVNEFSARLPNALCSVFTLITLFIIGKKFYSQKFGIIWSLLYTATLLPHLYFKSGLIDPWFNLFIFISVYNCIQFINNPNGKLQLGNSFFAGVCLGLAVLTKGPAALVIVALIFLVYFILSKSLALFTTKVLWLFIFTTILVSGSWFLVEFLNGNENIIKEFIEYQIRLLKTEDAGHGGPFIYHFVVLLIGCFPASLIFISSYFKKTALTPYQLLVRKIMLILFWVVLILFSIAKTKIVHYSSLCYFPITFISTIGIVMFFKELKLKSYLKIMYWIITSIITVLFIAVGFINLFKNKLINSNLIDDIFAKENLKADVHWSGFEWLVGVVFLIGAIILFIAIQKQKVKWVNYSLISFVLFIYFAIILIIPKVEQYTQHAAVEFYQTCAAKKCYVETHLFKSYAYLFYSNRLPSDYQNPQQLKDIEAFLIEDEKLGNSRYTSYSKANGSWMKNGLIDRPVYMVAKIQDEKSMFTNLEFKKLYSKNGFSFFERLPKATQGK
ncbi:MAG: glycosyltransferase family 39 protein [Bacteroidota bacterium]|nr:glycosyltransferase family 39 protein [Bacteroidota bacterium]